MPCRWRLSGSSWQDYPSLRAGGQEPVVAAAVLTARRCVVARIGVHRVHPVVRGHRLAPEHLGRPERRNRPFDFGADVRSVESEARERDFGSLARRAGEDLERVGLVARSGQGRSEAECRRLGRPGRPGLRSGRSAGTSAGGGAARRSGAAARGTAAAGGSRRCGCTGGQSTAGTRSTVHKDSYRPQGHTGHSREEHEGSTQASQWLNAYAHAFLPIQNEKAPLVPGAGSPFSRYPISA